MLVGNENARICCIDRPMYYYYSRSGSAIMTVSAEKLLNVVEVNYEWFCKAEEAHPVKMMYGTMMLDMLNRYRYMSTFSDDTKSVKQTVKKYFTPVWKYAKRIKAFSFKERIILKAVYLFPIIYRVQHLLADKMWLEWEKEQKALKKNRRKAKGNG